jgi:Tfp pilus assembly protein PilP
MFKQLSVLFALAGAAVSGVTFGQDTGTYERAGRRDPFRMHADDLRPATTCRTSVACYRVAEFHFQGTIKTPHGIAAMVEASGRSYLLRAGDPVFDGDLIEVSPDHLTFHRNLTDPLAPKPFETVAIPLRLPSRGR